MKSHILTILTLLLLVLSLLTACGQRVTSSDTSDMPKPYGYADDLVGCWVQEPDEDGNLAAYQFFSTGTYIVMYEDSPSDWYKDDGTWYTEKDGTILINGSVTRSYRFINKNLVEFSRLGTTWQMKRYDKNLSEIGDGMPRPDVWGEN